MYFSDYFDQSCNIIVNLLLLFAGTPTSVLSNTFPLRVVIRGHHPHEETTDSNRTGKLVHLPDSIEDLLNLAGMKCCCKWCILR